MLTAATLGMVGYATYAIATGLSALLFGSRIEGWASIATAGFGLLLLLSAAFVRVRLPGGVALALGALLGLQALAVHAAAHTPEGLTAGPQLVRGGCAVLLLGLALAGSRVERNKPHGLEADPRREGGGP